LDISKRESHNYDRIKKAGRGFGMNKVPYNRFIPWEFMKPGKKYKIRTQRTLEDFEHE
jgi:hypothetical protein